MVASGSRSITSSADRERCLTPTIASGVHGQGSPRSDAKFVENMVDMDLDRGFADEEPLGDLGVREPLTDELVDLALTP